MEKSLSHATDQVKTAFLDLDLEAYRAKTIVKEEVKRNPFAIDDFDAPSDNVNFAVDDDFSPVPFTPISSPPADSDHQFSKLSRQMAVLPKSVSESCEGYLNKKSPALFIKWQTRYFVLKNQRLYYFKNDKKQDQSKGIINFDHVACTLTFKSGKENRF